MQDPVQKIKKLPPQVVNQIAAGEVIERPASAVKELIDNSIDAGAKSIQIQIISQDGRSFKVIDDGYGIDKDDIELAFAPHATSKINDTADLNELHTLGFRGEALASISSIAKVTCTTKHVKAGSAYKASFDDTHKLSVSPAAFAKGTCIEVRDLFYNVPARLKFLKKAETELTVIQDTVRELALSNPQIAIELQVKNKTVIKTSGKADLAITLKELFSSQSSSQSASSNTEFKYLEVTKEDFEDTVLKGYIAPLSAARSDKRCLVTIVNGRPIKCDTILKAVLSVYRPFLPSGKYPQLVLSLDMTPSLVDFNVHPTKKEVRYTKPQIIYQLVHSALEKHLILNSAASSVQLFDEAKSQEQESSNRQVPQLKFDSFKSSVSSNQVFPKQQKGYEVSRIQSFINKLDSNREQSDATLFAAFEAKMQESRTQSVSKSPQKDNLLKVSEMKIHFDENLSQSSIRSDRGNSTDFTLSSGAFSLAGEVSGEKWIRDKFIRTLDEFIQQVSAELPFYESESEQISFVSKAQQSRPKLAIGILEKVWERDNYRCVYCGKHLLHPGLVKKALRVDPHSWVSRLGRGNKLIKTHILREHQATYDHLLPFKHNSSLAVQPNNLFASCRACNQAKSSSTDYKKWQPSVYPAWSGTVEKVKIGNLLFSRGFANAEFLLEQSVINA
ncbi:MAG: DNA mismatch repair endonuclease MutL [Candidatus Caenarcaniphilales bacterium]|nr:DNA mismatch repair endonuclease MutL [Candidatus Caenarcaniphilales bacterium]